MLTYKSYFSTLLIRIPINYLINKALEIYNMRFMIIIMLYDFYGGQKVERNNKKIFFSDGIISNKLKIVI
jgi:hypothetical protein